MKYDETKNLVVIKENIFVPGLGQGPFEKPFYATASQIRLWKGLKIMVTVVESDKTDEVTEVKEEISEVKENDSIKEKELVGQTTFDKEEVEAEEEYKEDEDASEDEKPERLEELEVAEEVSYEDRFKEVKSNNTVNELKTQLKKANIDFESDSVKDDLVKLFVENNL